MKQVDIVIIGGSAAGIPAAITCRRHYPEKKVMLIRKEKQVQIPCGDTMWYTIYLWYS